MTTIAELKILAKQLGVSRVLRVHTHLNGDSGQYIAAGEDESQAWHLKRRTANWLLNETANRSRPVIILNSFPVTDLTGTLAHELSHHISALAEGKNYRKIRLSPASPELLDSFNKAEFYTTSESREEVRAETLGQYLQGTKLPSLLRREVYTVLSKLSRRQPEFVSLIKRHRKRAKQERN